MPDLLDVRIIRVLATTQHLSLFAEKTVQGIVNCLWHSFIKHSVFVGMVLDVFALATLFAWISLADVVPSEAKLFQRSCWLITSATGLKELVNLVFALRLCSVIGVSPISYVLSVDIMVDLFMTSALLALAWCTRLDFEVPQVGWGRSILSLNVFLRWSQIMYMCRSRPKVGPKIVCVLKSFLPMKEMMIITVVVFFGFVSAAVLIKNNGYGECGDHCTPTVLTNVFKALLLGDGDAFDGLTELPGGDPNGIFASAIVVVATVVFTVCVLNLLIAVYSNEYDRKEKQSELLFFKERAGICFRHLMEPMWPNWRRQPAWFWERWEKRCGKPSGTAGDSEEAFVRQEAFVRRLVRAGVMALTVAALLASAWGWLLLPVLLLVTAMLALQVASKRCDWDHPGHGTEGLRFYLWICSRANFSKSDFQERKLEDAYRSIEDVHSSLRRFTRSMEKQVVEMREDLRHLQGVVNMLVAQPRSPVPALEQENACCKSLEGRIAELQEGMAILKEAARASAARKPGAVKAPQAPEAVRATLEPEAVRPQKSQAGLPRSLAESRSPRQPHCGEFMGNCVPTLAPSTHLPERLASDGAGATPATHDTMPCDGERPGTPRARGRGSTQPFRLPPGGVESRSSERFSVRAAFGRAAESSAAACSTWDVPSARGSPPTLSSNRPPPRMPQPSLRANVPWGVHMR